jgi:hypothetical protein
VDTGPAAGAPEPEARGLRGQAFATKDALLGLLRAHVDLAKAEADEIKGEVARAAALAGLAIACAMLLGLLLAIGSTLFYGEWVFGSIGWGLLHGTLLLTGVIVLAVMLALRAGGMPAMFLVAVIIGAVVALLLGPSLPNELWRRMGESTNLGVEAGVRPLVVGVIVLAIVGGVLGALLGARGGGGAAIGGLVAGALVGAVVGAISAITFGWRVGIAMGVAVGLGAWPVLMGVRVAQEGIDGEALKARFWPQATIDTTKETIEWAKARMPLGPRS